MYEDFEEILATREDIAKNVERLGEQISSDYHGKNLVLIGVLKSSYIFVSDLIRKINIPVSLDFISLSSYNGYSNTGVVRIKNDLDDSIEGKDLLIVEGIIDTGLTLSYLIRNFKTRLPSSIKVCTFIDKNAQRITSLAPDYVGMEIHDKFVVGYGLDYKNKYRNLPFVAVLKPELFAKEIDTLSPSTFVSLDFSLS